MRMLMIASLLCMAANVGVATEGITVRPSTSGRIWQVSYAPNEPVKWPWISDSTSAQLTVTSYSGRTKVSVYEIVREEDEYFGSYQLPSSDKEQLFDLEVKLLAGEKVLETLSARVAVLPEKIDVLVEGSVAWKTVRDRFPRPVAYDAAWKDPTAESTVFSVSRDSETQNFAMQGDSGFEPLDMTTRLGAQDGEFSVALTFNDDEEATFSANLRRTFPGLQLSIR